TKSKEGPVEHTLALAKDVRVTLPEGPKGDGKVADLPPGSSVVLTLSMDKQTVRGVSVQSPSLQGTVKGVDAGKRTLTVTVKEEGGLADKTLSLAKGVRVVLADAHEHEGQLADLAEGAAVVVQLSLDKKTARAITVHGPSLNGTLKGVDVGSNTLTVEVKEDG